MKRVLIKGGRVVDPGYIDGVMDITIEDGVITRMDPLSDNNVASDSPESADADCHVIDSSGKIVAPGFMDMHVHLREPGFEYKETILSGSQAAAAGGFTAVCTMPNTKPVNDSRQVTEYIIKKAGDAGLVRVYPVAAISMGLLGESLCEYGELKDAGAVAVSDDGCPVMDSLLMRHALEYAGGFQMPVISHCEELNLLSNGVMNEGPIATRMGLAGIPNAVESIMVMRDIALCELTGSPLHIAHVSTKQSVDAIREAKKKGIPITAETAPHYFSLTEDRVAGYDTHAKMNPPLRSRVDQEAVIEGLSDGTIDVIASDHAPHSSLEKNIEFDMAANGIVGLETSVAISLKLVHDNILSLSDLIEKMSINPGRVFGFDNHLAVGKPGDITILDLEKSHVIDPEKFRSKSKNTPFGGWEMKGKAVGTLVEGRVVFQDF